MEFVLESPVLKWFLDLDWDRTLTIHSPLDIYCNILPVLSTVVSSISFGFLCRKCISGSSLSAQLLIVPAAAYFFLRYVWFHGFIHYRRLLNEHFDIDVNFCGRFFEPGLAAFVAVVLSIVARPMRKETKDGDTGPKSIGDGPQQQRGAQQQNRLHKNGPQRNSNNHSAAGREDRFFDSTDDCSGSKSPTADSVSDEDALHPFGQLLYCQRCGQVVYESVADPFPPPLAPLSRPSIPKALVMRPEDGSPPTLRHLRCPNCVEIKMNAAGLRGVGPRVVSFAVGQHNLNDTRPKSILRGPNSN